MNSRKYIYVCMYKFETFLLRLASFSISIGDRNGLKGKGGRGGGEGIRRVGEMKKGEMKGILEKG